MENEELLLEFLFWYASGTGFLPVNYVPVKRPYSVRTENCSRRKWNWLPWQEALSINPYICAWSVTLPPGSHPQPASQHCLGCDWRPLIHLARARRRGLSQAGLTCTSSAISPSVESAQVLAFCEACDLPVWSHDSSSLFISPSHAQLLGSWCFSIGGKDFTLGNVLLAMGEIVNSV